MFLIVITLFAYWQVNTHEFVHLDDHEHISENRHLRDGLSLESVVWAFSFTDVAYWHPMTWLSLMLDYELYGLSPGGYHLTNLLLHILSALFLFLALHRMTGSLWQSGFVASLFALHPLNVESVVWAVERKNVLSSLFWMLTVWSYARYVERPIIRRYLLVLTVFALGLMSKPTLVTLPFVLLLLDYWPLHRLQLVRSGGQPDQPLASSTQPDGGTSIAFRLVREKVPFFTLAAVAIVLTVLSNQYLGSMVTTDSTPWSLRIGNALISYMGYVGKMMWPSKLAIYYPPPETIVWWQVTAAVLFLMIVSLLAIRTVKTRPYLAVGWLWYLGTLVPAIGLVRAGMWPAMADRFVYVPLIGLFIMVAWGVPELLAQYRYRKTILPVAAGMLFLALLVVTRTQVAHWKNSVTLFQHSLTVTAGNAAVHNNLGTALAEQGNLKEAIFHYTKALEFSSDSPGIYSNLGAALAEQGKVEEALIHYQEALKINPNSVDTHNNLGVALLRLGEINKAISHYHEALRLKPDSAETHNNLGVSLFSLGQVDQAIGHYRTAIKLDPGFGKAHNNLGNALARQGKLNEAIAHYTRALEIKADYPEAHNNLGVALAQQGKLNEAIAQFERALRLRPDYSQARSNLGNAMDLLVKTTEPPAWSSTPGR